MKNLGSGLRQQWHDGHVHDEQFDRAGAGLALGRCSPPPTPGTGRKGWLSSDLAARIQECKAAFLAVPAASSGGESSVSSLGVFFGAALLLSGVVVVFFILQRRQREQIRALLDRLERLEARENGGQPIENESLDTGEVPVGAGEGADSVTPSGDVLAGQTSHVRHLVESGGSTAQGLADQAIFRVHKHLEQNVTPGAIADELFVSLRTLERGLAVALDCTPSQLILAMKMREARRLLKIDHLRVSEVADRLGFANPFHFSRRFKSFYRVSPSELRQRAISAD